MQITVNSYIHNFNWMFFWPCIMIWVYINYQLDAPIIIYSQNIIFLFVVAWGHHELP